MVEAASSARDLSGSLVVMLTYDCQLRCAYCEVIKGAREMSWQTLRASVDLLFTARHERLQLRYFGGEPLLRFDLVKRAIEYAEERRSREGRSVRHQITTNGLLLDDGKLEWLSGHDVEILFSLDGSAATHKRQRQGPGGGTGYWRLRANLEALRRSGIPYFANLVLVPGGDERAREDLGLLSALGVGRVQIGYQVGVRWEAHERAGMVSLMEETLKRGGMEIMNLHNGCEPVMLTDEILIDTDGEILHDGAVFLERRFPRFRRALRLGNLRDGPDRASLQRSKAQVLRIIMDCYPPATPEGRLFLNNLLVGIEVGRCVERLRREGAAA